ncbi:MAG: hypothetical protein WAU88_06090 [Candidatus Zixiibacteriota bacterium]
MKICRIAIILSMNLCFIPGGKPRAQSYEMISHDPNSLNLRTAISTSYPQAKLDRLDRDTSYGMRLALQLANITPADIMKHPATVDTATIEQIARTFLAALSPELGIDTALLQKRSVRILPWGGSRISTRICFTQCCRNLHVYRSDICFQFINDHVMLDCHNAVPGPNLPTANTILPDSAAASIEWAERKRFLSHGKPHPVYGGGLISRILFQDCFDIRDSTGRWIPYEERVIGYELMIFPQVVGRQVVPRLAWRLGLGLGERGDRTVYQEALVDAVTGEVLSLQSMGGGCIVTIWSTTSCTSR